MLQEAGWGFCEEQSREEQASAKSLQSAWNENVPFFLNACYWSYCEQLIYAGVMNEMNNEMNERSVATLLLLDRTFKQNIKMVDDKYPDFMKFVM